MEGGGSGKKEKVERVVRCEPSRWERGVRADKEGGRKVVGWVRGEKTFTCAFTEVIFEPPLPALSPWPVSEHSVCVCFCGVCECMCVCEYYRATYDSWTVYNTQEVDVARHKHYWGLWECFLFEHTHTHTHLHLHTHTIRTDEVPILTDTGLKLLILKISFLVNLVTPMVTVVTSILQWQWQLPEQLLCQTINVGGTSVYCIFTVQPNKLLLF